MVEEMTSLHSSGTWDLVTLPAGKTLVGCRWVYTVKIGSDGQVDCLKARLVAKGTLKSMVSTTMIPFPLSPRLPLFVFSYIWLLCNHSLFNSWT